jgi:NAD(P)H-nitrite reductase large subunit
VTDQTGSASHHVVVIGAGAGGLSTVEGLRRRGFAGALTMIGAESRLPYDRPPLSKQVLSGDWAPDRALLRPDDALAALDVRMLVGEAATGLDADERIVRTTEGRTLSADAVVVATGARARGLPGAPELAGVHTIRTLDDALRLRSELRAGARMVVVGDGVLGTEVAATACRHGLAVTLTGPQQLPMAAQLGTPVARSLAELHRVHGVDLRTGAGTRALHGEDGRVTGVELSTGEVLAAEVVVIALGALPDVGWLTDSGLALQDGLSCDAYCRAVPRIYGVGDVARFHHLGLGRSIRLENRTNATEQAAVVAGNVLADLGSGTPVPYTPTPYLWTDQYDTKLQVVGLTGDDLETRVLEGDLGGDPRTRRFVVGYHRDDELVGALGWAMPRPLLTLRRQLAERFAATAILAA